MARTAAVSVENSFVKGLITEATGLNFPENAVTDTDNCIFDLTGEVYRRPGIEYESDFQAAAFSFTDVAVVEYLWQSVGQDGDKTFLVVQIGLNISLYEMDTSSTLSSHESFNFSLGDHEVAGAVDTATISASFAAGNGLLFIAHPNCEPMYIERSASGDFSVTEITLTIRDVEGLDNTDANGALVAVDHRPDPSELSPNILYNLKNQGWDTVYWCTVDPRGGTLHDQLNVLDFFRDGWDNRGATHKYPAESETWWEYKVPTGGIDDQGNPVSDANKEVFSSPEFQTQIPRTTPAPKGHYTYNAFYIDRATKASVPGIDVETAGNARPSQVAFFAGRVWYSGVNAAGFNTRLYFSKIIQHKRYVGDCFQVQDPTQEDGGDEVASDGGFISIPDIARVVKMIQVGFSLFVFGTNGTWVITGSQGLGFTTTDYSVSRVSTTGAVSDKSFIIAEGAPIWWNLDGIWTIKSQNNSASVESLSKSTIDTYLSDNLPSANVAYVKGAYNPLTRVVQWLFRTAEAETFTDNYQYDKIMNLDLNTGAFYPWSLPDSCLKLIGIICIYGPSTKLTDTPVTDNDGIYVTDNADAVVNVQIASIVETASRFKYITINTCDLITSNEPAGATFDSGFIGDLDDTFESVLDTRNYQTTCIGLDGKFYVPCATNSDTDDFAILDVSGSIVDSYIIDQATVSADIEGDTGSLTGGVGWSTNNHRIIPFPYSEYYYVVMENNQSGSNTYKAFALYKIKADGTHEYQAVRVFDANFQYLFLNIHGVGYKGQGANALTNSVLAAIDTDNHGCAILELPSVTNLLASGNDTGNPAEDEATLIANLTIVSDDLGFFDRNDTNLGIGSGLRTDWDVFILPTLTGQTWSNMVAMYVNKSVIDYYVAHPTDPGGIDYSPDLQALVAANYATSPNGFVVTRTLTGSSWSVSTTLGAPFSDEAQERDGSASTTNRGSWLTPSLRYHNDTQNYLLTWVRRYDNTEDNLTPTGAYHRAKVFLYDPSDQTVTLVSDVSGNTYDVVDDLGFAEGARYDYCPKNAFILWNADCTVMYVYSANFGFGTDDRTIFAQFGTFIEPEVGTVSVSFSEFNNEDTYLDWESHEGGVDFTSFFVTGYKLRGQGIKRFQTNYIELYVRNTIDSTFDFQSRWDYATSGNTGRWSNTQRVTVPTGNYAFQRKRLLLRGAGLVSQFYVSSVSGEPFNIIGWSAFETGNANI